MLAMLGVYNSTVSGEGGRSFWHRGGHARFEGPLEKACDSCGIGRFIG